MEPVALNKTNPEQAAFFMGLFTKARDAYSKENYIPVCDQDDLEGDQWKRMCDHMDIEMVRLGFEFGRMYERLGVAV